ncbi:hypothetical protein [Streptacidiphilus sp. MAP5-3]|uniref:hypothetical protein n=1 Tax=unclassified Streptacidiphilus TaxID=2643834 RepID=UPI00351484C2
MSDQQQYENANEYGYEYGQQPHQHQQAQQQFEQHGMSGFPIDPGVGAPQTAESDAERTAYLPPIPAAPSQSQQAHQAPQTAQASYGYPQAEGPGGPLGYGGHGSDAEQTAYLPPIVDGHAPDAYQAAAGQSRFGHIQEHYGTGEFPVQQPVAEPLAQAAPASMSASMPASVPEAESADSPWPDGWERPAAPPAAWAPQPSGAAPTPPRHAAPQPQGFALGSVEAGPGGSTDNAFEQTSYLLSVPAPVASEPKAAPASGEADNAFEQTSYMLPVPVPVPVPVPAPAEPGNPFEETSYLLAVPAPENASEQTAYLPPIPPLPSDAGAPGGAGGSLREAFAAAQPTGPVAGRPRPLDAQSGGSLREAFAAAQPTGVGAPAPQPARRTGSPIIDPGIQPGALTLVLSALIGVSALAGRYGLAVPVLLLQAVTAAGWFRLNGMWPARQGIALAALGGVVADAAILAASSQSSAPTVIAGTLGAFFVLVLVLQIFKPSNPDERFYALTVSASATVVTVLGAAFLAVGNGKAVLAGALAAGVSALLRRPAALGFGAGAVAGLAVGAGIAAATGLGLVEGALLGIAAGACGLIGRRVAAYDFPSRFVHMTAGVALPLAAAAPVVYLIAR